MSICHSFVEKSTGATVSTSCIYVVCLCLYSVSCYRKNAGNTTWSRPASRPCRPAIVPQHWAARLSPRPYLLVRTRQSAAHRTTASWTPHPWRKPRPPVPTPHSVHPTGTKRMCLPWFIYHRQVSEWGRVGDCWEGGGEAKTIIEHSTTATGFMCSTTERNNIYCLTTLTSSLEGPFFASVFVSGNVSVLYFWAISNSIPSKG